MTAGIIDCERIIQRIPWQLLLATSKIAKARRQGSSVSIFTRARSAQFCLRRELPGTEVSLLEMIKKAKYGWGWRREITLYSPGEGNDVSKKWKSDLVGYDPSGTLCVIDATVFR